MADDSTTDKPWWGTFEVAVGDCALWQIGSLSLWVAHLAEEWRVAYDRSEDAMADALSLDRVNAPREHPWPATLERYCTQDFDDRLRLQPALADRAVMSRTIAPISVLPDEEITIYVSSPVWVHILVGDNDTLLCELPTFRPSDTWFGSPTGDGELSYASRSFSRLDLESLPQRPHRALSAVRIRNRAHTTFRLTSLNLPAPQLRLYASSGGALWTESITVDREEGQPLAQILTDQGPPEEIGEAELVAEPRRKTNTNILARVFSGFFHTHRGHGA